MVQQRPQRGRSWWCLSCSGFRDRCKCARSRVAAAASGLEAKFGGKLASNTADIGGKLAADAANLRNEQPRRDKRDSDRGDSSISTRCAFDVSYGGRCGAATPTAKRVTSRRRRGRRREAASAAHGGASVKTKACVGAGCCSGPNGVHLGDAASAGRHGDSSGGRGSRPHSNGRSSNGATHCSELHDLEGATAETGRTAVRSGCSGCWRPRRRRRKRSTTTDIIIISSSRSGEQSPSHT